MAKQNEHLKDLYDSIYKKGEEHNYTSLLFPDANDENEVSQTIRAMPSWEGLTVLDVGCGTGALAREIAKLRAKSVLGIDYSEEAIKIAKDRNTDASCSFHCGDFLAHVGDYDVVTSLGTLEHMDDPLFVLRKMRDLTNRKGTIIVTTPNWLNPRGYILQALRFLFDAPITLADLHYLTPIEFQAWASDLDMRLTWKTFDNDWAQGRRMIDDFKRRLPNVLIRDMGGLTTQAKIDQLIEWLQVHVSSVAQALPHSGALGLYKFDRR